MAGNGDCWSIGFDVTTIFGERQMPKKHSITKQAEAIRKRQLYKARQIVAHRLPEDRYEIMAGEYDRGPAIASALKDVQLVEKYGDSK
jgi:hypothetical protein